MKVQTLLDRHANSIDGTLECFDRVLLAGTYQVIGWPGAMLGYLCARGIKVREFASQLANRWREEINHHIRAVARAERVTVRQVQPSERKEEIVAELLKPSGAVSGTAVPVSVLTNSTFCSPLFAKVYRTSLRPSGDQLVLMSLK